MPNSVHIAFHLAAFIHDTAHYFFSESFALSPRFNHTYLWTNSICFCLASRSCRGVSGGGISVGASSATRRCTGPEWSECRVECPPPRGTSVSLSARVSPSRVIASRIVPVEWKSIEIMQRQFALTSLCHLDPIELAFLDIRLATKRGHTTLILTNMTLSLGKENYIRREKN